MFELLLLSFGTVGYAWGGLIAIINLAALLIRHLGTLSRLFFFLFALH